MRIRNHQIYISLLVVTCSAFSPSWHSCRLQRCGQRNALLDPVDDDDDEPLSSEYNSVELDEDEMLTGPQGLEQALTRLFSQSSNQKQNMPNSLHLMMDNPNIPDLEALVKEREGSLDYQILSNERKNSNHDDDDGDDNDNDAVWLGEDEYANFRSLMNPDGTIRPPGGSHFNHRNTVLQTSTLNPEVGPGECISDDDENHSLQDLLLAKPPLPNSVDESLHEQVMRNEQGFFKSSQAFSNFLGPDGSKFAKEARSDRRSKHNQEQQKKQQALLEQELKEIEASLPGAPNKGSTVCRKCRCALSPLEVSHAICAICYSEDLISASDFSYIDQIPQFFNPRGNSNDWDSRDNGFGANSPSIQWPQRPPIAQPKQTKVPKQINTEILLLQNQVKKYKRQCDLAEQEIIRLRNLVADLQDDLASANESYDQVPPSDPWTKVVDPDSGEEFYFNVDTEEVTWEI